MDLKMAKISKVITGCSYSETFAWRERETNDDVLLTTYIIWNKLEWSDDRTLSVRKIDIIHFSTNIDFLRKSSLFWFIYIRSNRKRWFDIIGFLYSNVIFKPSSFDLSMENFTTTIQHIAISHLQILYSLYYYCINWVDIP